MACQPKSKGKRILVLSPHADDAELGAGGFIAKAVNEGAKILWLVFSTAKESLPKGWDEGTLKTEFLKVVNCLGIKEHEVFDFPVRNLPYYRQEILDILVAVQRRFDPDIVVGPSLNDNHQDHLAIAHEMVRAFKVSSSIICYEFPWNSVKSENQLFVKLTAEQVKLKVKLLSIYESQRIKNKKYFNEDFVWSLAKVRGVQINEDYAEAFEVIRWIVN